MEEKQSGLVSFIYFNHRLIEVLCDEENCGKAQRRRCFVEHLSGNVFSRHGAIHLYLLFAFLFMVR